MGILGVVAIPFGFDGPCWQAMGFGIDWMIAVVLWVAHLPGALGRLPAFGTGPLLLGTLALLVLCLLRTPLRWSGAVLAVIASLWAVLAPRPDIFISTDGQTAAVRAGDGQLRLLHSGRDSFALKEWLAADADSRDVKHATVADGARCDAIGCAATLKDGRLVTMALATEALAEDCTRAAVVISPHEANRPCGATLIDRKVWRPRGAMTLRWTGEAFEARYAQPPGYDRPWARELVEVRPAPAQDATPPIENLDADD
jgi:competence protein ComEC